MRALLRQRRLLTFCLLVVAVALSCGLLSKWQWSRYELRQEQNAQLDAALAAPVVPISTLVEPRPPQAGRSEPDPRLQWRQVSATGYFEDSGTVAVRRRPLNGRNGFWIVTPLVTRDGTVLVNRGWAPAGGDALTAPVVPPPPAGESTIEGRLRAPQATSHTGAPPRGQAWDVDPDALLTDSAPRFDAYIELTDSDTDAAATLTALPMPEHRGTNNLIYSIQWVLFGLVALIGGWRLMVAQREAPPAFRAPSPRAGVGPAGLNRVTGEEMPEAVNRQ